MTDKSKSVETLQTDVDKIAADLAEAKKLTDETLKKSKAEAAAIKAEVIANEVKTAKEEANKKLEALAGKTDAISKAEILKLEKEIKKYEAMLTTLDSSKIELATLKAGVVVPVVDDTTEKTDATKDKTTENKNWFKKQRDGLSDSTEENHALKNTARIVGGVAGVYLVYRGIKALFGRGKKEKKDDETTEKKSFLGKAWDVIKVVALGGGIYYVIHGLVTGKWSMSDFFNRDKKAGYESNDPKKFDEVYDKESAENKVKYDELGTAVNDFFGTVYGSATGETGSDMLGEQSGDDAFEKHTGTMPCALDDASTDVGDILDGTSDFGKKLDTFGAKVSKDVGKQINPLNRFSGAGASEEDLAKLDKETIRKYQAYRKTLKVQVFLHQKEKVLIRRLVAEKLGITDYATATESVKKTYEEKIDEGMDDDATMTAVQTKMEAVYYNQKLTGVMAVFKKYDIANDEMVEDTKQSIVEVDQDKNDLVGDTLDKATASTDINSDTTLKDDVDTLCTDFDTKINAEDNQLVDFDNFFIGLGDAWLNMEAGDKKNVLESIGYTEKVGVYSTKVLAIKEKIANGTATKADMADLKQTIEDYYIFKKDIVLGISFAHEADDKSSGLERTLMYIGGKLIAVLERARDKGGIVGVTVAAFVMRQAGKAILKGGKKLVLTSGGNRIRGLGKDPGRVLPGRRLYRYVGGENYVSRLVRKQAYKGDKGFGIFKDRFNAGKIQLSEAQEIIDANGGGRTKTTSVDELLSGGGYVKNSDTLAQKRLINAYFDKNINFRKGVKGSNRAKVLSSITEYDLKVQSIPVGETKKLQLMEDIFTYARFKKGDELLGVVRNIDAIDISTLEDAQITDLAKKLGKKITVASTAADITKHIDEIKKTVTTTVDVIDNAKLSTITNMIDNELITTKAKWTSMTPGSPDYSIIRKNYYEESIEGLEEFKQNARKLTDVDYSSILKLSTHGLNVGDISKINKLRAVTGLEDITDALKNGKFDDLITVLRAAESDVRFVKYADDIGELANKFDSVARGVANVGDDIAPLLKNMDNIFKLFTKIT